MNFKIRKITKVSPGGIKVLATSLTSCTACTPNCDPNDPSDPTCTTTSYLYPSTPLNDAQGNLIGNIDPNGYQIYTIGWFASNICQYGFFNSCSPKPSDTSAFRSIDQYVPIEMAGIPYWPVPAQIPGTSGTSNSDFYFGYLCANESIVTDIKTCKCANGTYPPATDFGICNPTGQAPIGPTPYYTAGNIVILQTGYYALQMVIDSFSPSCPAVRNSDGHFKYLPYIAILKYDNINQTDDTSNATVLTANFDSQCHYTTISQCFGTKTFTVFGNQFTVWTVGADGSSLVIPPVQQSDSGNEFYNTWYLEEGNILQYAIKNVCNGAGTEDVNPGNFWGLSELLHNFKIIIFFPLL